MDEPFRISKAYKALRKKAEQLLQDKRLQLTDADQLDLARLAHEFEVQQVELELQNDELRHSIAQIEVSRQEFADLYHWAPVAFVTLDANGLVEMANHRASQLLAGSEAFLIDRDFSTLVFSEDRSLYYSFLKQTAEHRAGFCELRIMGKVGHVLFVQLSGVVKKDQHGSITWRLGLIDITARKQAEDHLRRAHSYLEEKVAQRTAELTRKTSELDQRNRQLSRLTAELTLAEQRERRRMAEILHDHMQQILAGARLNLEIVSEQHALEDDPAFKEVCKLVQMALQTSRTLSAELSPPVLYMHGLCEALKWLARWMESTHKLTVELHTDPLADPAQEELKVLLFQSVRELLFNVVKHAGTDQAAVDMQRQNDGIRITVRDNGTGFDPRSVLESRRSVENGYGLFNIRERLMLLGGTCDISSSKSDGTTITLTAPLQAPVFEIPERRKTQAEHRQPQARIDTVKRRSDDKIRVLLVDDHKVMRKGLSSMISRHDDIEIAGEAADGGQAVEQARLLNPDVVLMDLSMPVMDGLEATRIIHDLLPGVKIIGLSMYDDDEQADAMYKAGAVGFISKSGSPDVIISTIRQFGSGQ